MTLNADLPRNVMRPDFNRLDQLGVSLLRDWLAADPGHARGAGEYYAARLSRGKLLVDNELAIADYCQKHFGSDACFVEMGTGFGELSLMLALSGFRATGFESDTARYAGASALKAGLGEQGLDVDRLSLVCGLFPPALELDRLALGGQTVFVSTNVTSSYVMEKFDSILVALRLFDHLIVDLARFGTVRDEQSRRGLVAAFERHGFSEIACIYSASGSDVRHFERKQRGGEALPALASTDVEPEEAPVEPFDFATDLRWDEQLDDLLVPVLQHQLERFGTEETGAYHFYSSRLSGGRLLAEYEIAVARELLGRRNGITHIDEVGSGFGELVFLLGWNGFQVRGFEAGSARARMARRLRTVLEMADPELTRRVTLLEENFPSGAGPPPAANSLVLTTNLVATRTPEQQLETVLAMRSYTFALVDVQRFFDKREDEASQEAVLGLFAKAGFASPEEFLNLGESGRYILFANEHPVQSRLQNSA